MAANRQPFGKLVSITDADKATGTELVRRIDGEIREIEREIEARRNQIIGLQLAKAVIEQSLEI